MPDLFLDSCSDTAVRRFGQVVMRVCEATFGARSDVVRLLREQNYELVEMALAELSEKARAGFWVSYRAMQRLQDDMQDDLDTANGQEMGTHDQYSHPCDPELENVRYYQQQEPDERDVRFNFGFNELRPQEQEVVYVEDGPYVDDGYLHAQEEEHYVQDGCENVPHYSQDVGVNGVPCNGGYSDHVDMPAYPYQEQANSTFAPTPSRTSNHIDSFFREGVDRRRPAHQAHHEPPGQVDSAPALGFVQVPGVRPPMLFPLA